MNWERERFVVNKVFSEMLKAVTGDGSKKRQSGEKPPWWMDRNHEAAIFSHLNKWKHGEKKDPDSGKHPLVHLAWRAMAIAYQETYGQVDPDIYRQDKFGLDNPKVRVTLIDEEKEISQAAGNNPKAKATAQP